MNWIRLNPQPKAFAKLRAASQAFLLRHPASSESSSPPIIAGVCVRVCGGSLECPSAARVVVERRAFRAQQPTPATSDRPTLTITVDIGQRGARSA